MSDNWKVIECGATAVVEGVAVRCCLDQRHMHLEPRIRLACQHGSPVLGDHGERLWITWTEFSCPTVGGVLDREGRA